MAGGARGWLRVGQVFGLLLLPGLGSAAPAPRFLGTQPPCATHALKRSFFLFKNIASSRLEYNNHTLINIKMTRIHIFVMNKTAEKPYPLGLQRVYSPYKLVLSPPPPFALMLSIIHTQVCFPSLGREKRASINSTCRNL